MRLREAGCSGAFNPALRKWRQVSLLSSRPGSTIFDLFSEEETNCLEPGEVAQQLRALGLERNLGYTDVRTPETSWNCPN